MNAKQSAPFRVSEETDNKIEALLARMTLTEKIGQMTQRGTLKDTDKQMIREGKIGSFLNVRGADEVNALQRIAVEETRLGIPLIIGDDVIHGYRTIFPIPLAEASSWNPELLEETAAIAAAEASADGIHWIFAPMVDIARDARWGRIAEGAGEDTYLGSVIAGARVRGFQRNDWNGRPHIAACAKHFAGYGLSEAGRDYNTVDVSDYRLRDTYFPPFRAALAAGAGTVMSSFNDLNGVPSTGNEWLLKNVLQDEWGFQGFVVSDWESIDELVQHGHAASRKEAAQTAAQAGTHMDMHARIYDENLAELVQEAKIAESVIDDAVRRILRLKYWLGLFDHPYADPTLAAATMMHARHLETAREIARQSIVLLKNEGGLLPLRKSLGSVAVIGPLADARHDAMGCWAGQGREDDVVDVLQGLTSRFSADTRIVYAKGCDVRGEWAAIEEAANTAARCDVAIVVVGESADMSGENNSRVSIDLPGRQLELLQAVHATGTPVIAVLMNGRPLSIPWVADYIPAVVEAWQLGTQTGHAVADVLLGDYNPSGKLPVTFPRSVGQVPLYYSARKTGRPHMKRYADEPFTPLFPFGFGLSYTRFEYEELRLSANSMAADGEVSASVSVRNAGEREGEEIVQLYVGDVAASLTRAEKELKGFRKISLKPGESREVEFRIGKDELGFFNAQGTFKVEPGAFKVWIGPNSAEGLEGSFEVSE